MSNHLAPPAELLAALRCFEQTLTRPIWLFGGVAVDFLVGRWTRPHGDLDLMAFSVDRTMLTVELSRCGYTTSHAGWLTHWHHAERSWYVEITFLEPAPQHSGVLVVTEADQVGTPGRYPLPTGYLDPERFAQLEGVSARVCSPEGELLRRTRATQLFPDRPPLPKLDHDRRLLEELIHR